MNTIIVAMAKNRVIGNSKLNSMVWHLRSDFKHFKSLTMGHPIIMGGRTFESVGKPLPGRTTIVVSNDPEYTVPEGVILVDNIPDALKEAKSFDSEIYIIGGGMIFKSFMEADLVDKIELTFIDENVEGDVLFPEIDPENWKLVSAVKQEKTENDDYDMEFRTYVKNN